MYALNEKDIESVCICTLSELIKSHTNKGISYTYSIGDDEKKVPPSQVPFLVVKLKNLRPTKKTTTAIHKTGHPANVVAKNDTYRKPAAEAKATVQTKEGGTKWKAVIPTGCQQRSAGGKLKISPDIVTENLMEKNCQSFRTIHRTTPQKYHGANRTPQCHGAGHIWTQGRHYITTDNERILTMGTLGDLSGPFDDVVTSIVKLRNPSSTTVHFKVGQELSF